MNPSRSLRLPLFLLVLLLAPILAGCAGSDAESASSDAADAPAALAPADGAAAVPQAPSLALTKSEDSTVATSGSGTRTGAATGSATAVQQAAVISTGNVALRADDVADARFEVQKVTDRYAGQITDEDATTGDDGAIATSRMVLRIPSTDFGAAMDALEKVADLESSNSSSTDVTTKVVDNAVRIKVERASISRIQALLARARSIRDIVGIEAQLSQRQADLNSLERQQAYLASQTSMSTITVSVERTPEKKAAVEKKQEAGGFLGGLSHGWDALVSFGGGLALVAGALLPWLIVALVLGVPAVMVTRRSRRRAI